MNAQPPAPIPEPIPAPDPVIEVGGRPFTPDRSGALFDPDGRVLIVADLHLEKGSAFLRRGVPLPPFDSRATLAALADALARLKPRRVIALGDSFHDVAAGDRLADDDRRALVDLVEAVAWVWVLGNHDPTPPQGIGGEVAGSWTLGGVTLRHEPVAGAGLEIAGHLHPVAAVRAGGRRLRRRCFVGDGRRLVLPAFGAYAGGLNVLDPAFAPLLGSRFHAWMIGADAIYRMAADRLVPDFSHAAF